MNTPTIASPVPAQSQRPLKNYPTERLLYLTTISGTVPVPVMGVVDPAY